MTVRNGSSNRAEVRLGRDVLHQDLAGAGAQERRLAGEHLVEHRAHGVDVDRLVVPPATDLRGHVVDGADGDGLAGVLGRLHGLGEAVVADLDVAVLVEDVPGLEVAVDDAAVVEERQALADLAEEEGRLLRAQPAGRLVQQLPQAGPGDELHDDEGASLVVVLDVEDRDQVRVLEVHALADAAQLDLLVAGDGLEGHLAAGVADGVVDLAKPAAPGGPLDGEAPQRLVPVLVLE